MDKRLIRGINVTKTWNKATRRYTKIEASKGRIRLILNDGREAKRETTAQTDITVGSTVIKVLIRLSVIKIAESFRFGIPRSL